jgi:hypothetical protein
VDAIPGLLNQLRALAQGAGEDGAVLTASLTTLEASLGEAVPSYLGLQLTLTQNGYPVVLTAASAGVAATTSLRIPLTLVTAGCQTGSQIVFFATTPGAFVDLVADLREVLGGADAGPVLDADLPQAGRALGLSGRAELGEINRAVGVLIERGTDPDKAHDALRRHAYAAGLQPRAYAQEVLRGAGPPGS